MRLANRVIVALDEMPHGLTTALLIARCGLEGRSARSRMWEQLKRLERFGRVARASVVRGKGEGVRWVSRKWVQGSSRFKGANNG